MHKNKQVTNRLLSSNFDKYTSITQMTRLLQERKVWMPYLEITCMWHNGKFIHRSHEHKTELVANVLTADIFHRTKSRRPNVHMETSVTHHEQVGRGLNGGNPARRSYQRWWPNLKTSASGNSVFYHPCKESFLKSAAFPKHSLRTLEVETIYRKALLCTVHDIVMEMLNLLPGIMGS